MRWPGMTWVIGLYLILTARGSAAAAQPVAASPAVSSSESVSGSENPPGSGSLQPAPRVSRVERFLGRLRRPSPEHAAASEAPAQPEAALPDLQSVSTPPAAPPSQGPRTDSPVRRARAGPGEAQLPLGPGVAPPIPAGRLPSNLAPAVGAQSISLEAALYGTLTGNPDLASLRLGNATTPSAESVEVARHFPTSLNPTLWCDLRPIVLIPPDPFGGGGGARHGAYYKMGQFYFYLSLRQPVELGHQTTHRYHVARAAYEQQKWNVVQAELLAIVQTYRFYQTAAYRRERLRVAQELAAFNDNLLATLEHRLEANQVPAADVVMAKVESRATRQLVKAAQQDYLAALTDLRNQIGIPESAGTAEPLGAFTLPPYIPPVQEADFIKTALEFRPDIHAAQALVAGTKAAENLARGDRIPSPIIGPQYELDEAGLQYFGLVYVTPIPIWNNGAPLVRQRVAEHQRAHIALQQAQQRAVAQVRSALAKWNGASELVKETEGLTAELAVEVTKLERLFNAGQLDLGKLLQAQQRLIQLKNSEIDSIWAATQGQADLLLALGAPALLERMLNQGQNAAPAPSPVVPPDSSPAATPSPFTRAAFTAPENVSRAAR